MCQIVERAAKQCKSVLFEIRENWKSYLIIRVWNTATIFRSSQRRDHVHTESVSSISQFWIVASFTLQGKITLFAFN